MLNNYYSLEPRTKSNNDPDQTASLPKQTLLDFSWRSQNNRYVVGQHKDKTIFEKNFMVKRWIKTLTTYIWAIVVDLYLDIIVKKVWIWFCFLFRTPTKKWIQYQTIHYYPTPKLSPVSSHVLRIVKRKTLVLDLDETLIHSHHNGNTMRKTEPPTKAPDFVLKVQIDNSQIEFYVHKRPYLDYFLSVISQWYDLVVFTASLEIYGTLVADKLDRKRNIFRQRYFRQHCTLDYGSYTKDLSAINPDLSSIFILDNSPGAYKDYPHNAIPIKSWFSDPNDTALLNLLPVLDALRFVSDVRSVLCRNRAAYRMSANH